MKNETNFAPVVGRWIVIEKITSRYYASLREDLTEDELGDFYNIFGIAAEGVTVDSETSWVADRIAKYCQHAETFCDVLEGEFFSPDPDGFIGVGDSIIGDEDSPTEREFLFEVECRGTQWTFYFMAELLRYGRTEIYMVDDSLRH